MGRNQRPTGGHSPSIADLADVYLEVSAPQKIRERSGSPAPCMTLQQRQCRVGERSRSSRQRPVGGLSTRRCLSNPPATPPSNHTSLGQSKETAPPCARCERIPGTPDYPVDAH